MSQISRGRTDQFCNFMRVLKLGTVDLHHSIRVAVQNLSSSFYNPSLSGTGRSEKEHCADRSIWGIHTSKKNLVQTTHTAHSAFLTNDARRKPLFKIRSEEHTSELQSP